MWVSVCTEACNFSKLFPGIRLHPLTLQQNFKIPFWRDFLLSFGLCSVSKKSCDFLLRGQPGSSILIVPGGAREALDCHPGTNRLTLNRRKGFVKVALTNGASLVPIFSFGENDIFLQVDNSEGIQST
jgi:2-acylglycerol O-acyltransferase 2